MVELRYSVPGVQPSTLDKIDKVMAEEDMTIVNMIRYMLSLCHQFDYKTYTEFVSTMRGIEYDKNGDPVLNRK